MAYTTEQTNINKKIEEDIKNCMGLIELQIRYTDIIHILQRINGIFQEVDEIHMILYQ